MELLDVVRVPSGEEGDGEGPDVQRVIVPQEHTGVVGVELALGIPPGPHHVVLRIIIIITRACMDIYSRRRRDNIVLEDLLISYLSQDLL